MPNRSRTAADFLDPDIEEAEAEKPRVPKKPRKRKKSASRERLHSDQDVPSVLPTTEPIPADDVTVVEARAVVLDAEVAGPDAVLGPSRPEAVTEPGNDVAASEPSWIKDEGLFGAIPDVPPAPARTGTVADSPIRAEDGSAPAADRKNGESSMNEDIKQNVKARDTWVRLAYMILFGVVFYFGQFVVGLLAVVQFLHKLLNSEPHARLKVFGAGLAAYYREIVEFLSYQSEQIPFPFSPWPRTAADSDQGGTTREAAQN